MVTENPLKMLSELGMHPLVGSGGEGSYGEDLGKELGALLREQRRQEAIDRERELNLFRSGSAPPTVEGSLSAIGGLFGNGSIGDSAISELSKNNGLLSEEELRSDPAYLSYYYSNVNLNPRLPPPVLSKEDWRFAQRLQAGSSVFGGIGDRRKVNNSNNRVDDGGSRSLFSLQPSFTAQTEESDVEARKAQTSERLDRAGDGLIGLPMGRQKSFAEIFQEDLGNATPISTHPSRPASRNAFDESVETLSTTEAQLAKLHHEITSGTSVQTMSGAVQGIGGSNSQTYAAALGAPLSRSTTPDPQLIARAPSPRLPPVGARVEKKNFNGSASFKGSESADLVAALSSMSLSANGMVDDRNHLKPQIQPEIEEHQSFLFDLQSGQNHMKQQSYGQSKNNGSVANRKGSALLADGPIVSSSNSYLKVVPPPTGGNSDGSSSLYQNVDPTSPGLTNLGLGGYSINSALPSMMASQLGTGNLPPLFENAAAAASGISGLALDARSLSGGLPSGSSLSGAAAELQNHNRVGSHAGALQMPLMDPLYFQYLRTAEYASQIAAGLNDPSVDRNFMPNSYLDLLGLQKAYLGTLPSPQKSQYGMQFAGKSNSMNHFYGNPAFGVGMSYPGNPMLTASPVGPGSPMRHGDRSMRYAPGMRGFGGVMGSWHSNGSGHMDEGFASSLLEEFKSNKTKCFELSEIADHVVEFSADQYGSRFIQQKLETATLEEKDMVFQEIIPQALSLMTDVFGNYVIQKFFEHGTAAQRRELANQLTGHVLTLSLQMYGCRVIQKAIEVVDLDQQTKMVAELDGHVMRCVRDQNGNHVIQKCIECIPQDAIQFIISSFYDQVVTLSTHPYGCRVIQRVLEHCDDSKTQRIMMDEILQSVCMLAQDQYGNYVVQHVLEHGKPHERSAVIKKLAGQIVQMSQQKFASNVVEKCLTFGGPVERQILVNEMLGTTDENEPLQAMMKDQFANYVVQKVLETCDDQQRELILSRIKVHLSALKKYTYGKHIVARVEKLVAAGEKRIGMQSMYPSS